MLVFPVTYMYYITNILTMANPMMDEKTFSGLGVWNEVMTLQGTVNKSILLIAITILSAIAVWSYAALFIPYILPIILFAFVFSLVISFKKETAPYLSTPFAIIEWIVIGTISAFYEAQFPGIVIQATSLTFATFGLMLFLYKTKVIQVTDKFRAIVAGATGAIMVVYLVSIMGSLTGWYNVPYIHDSGAIGIGISIFIVGIAAFNLALDFDLIDRGVQSKAPKFMEWYASFGILITLVWLYIEILRLLWKMRR